MQCTKSRQDFFALQHTPLKTWANLLKASSAALCLRTGNHVSAMMQEGRVVALSSWRGRSAKISEVGVANALWSTILLLPGGLEGAHLLQTGISPNATVLTAIAAFLLLLTKI